MPTTVSLRNVMDEAIELAEEALMVYSNSFGEKPMNECIAEAQEELGGERFVERASFLLVVGAFETKDIEAVEYLRSL